MKFRQLPIRSGGGGGSTTLPGNLTLEDGGELNGQKRVRVRWGVINNIQSDQFTAGDRLPLYFNVSGEGLIYAVQTANLRTRRWTKAEIKQGTQVPDNTNTQIFTLIGTYTIVNNVLYVISREGGDIEHSFCELSVSS